MMDTLRSFIGAFAAVTLLLSLVQAMIPEGGIRRIASFTGGLVLLAVLLRPLLDLDMLRLRLEWEDLRESVWEQQVNLEEEARSALAECIAEKTAAYISDKAAEMGLDAVPRVGTISREDGVILPNRVELPIPYSAALAKEIERELGIPAERQVWDERET